MLIPPLACQHHNHRHCIEDAIAAAHRICKAKKVRLTPLREQVLTLIWQSHKPLGAYALMEMLAAHSTRRVAPPTVYRALDFLREQGLIHRINSLNAFVGCSEPDIKHQNYFLICHSCGVAAECNGEGLEQAVQGVAEVSGFQIKELSVEIVGICPNCQETEL